MALSGCTMYSQSLPAPDFVVFISFHVSHMPAFDSTIGEG